MDSATRTCASPWAIPSMKAPNSASDATNQVQEYWEAVTPPPQPPLIAQRLGEGLGLAQVVEDRPVVAEHKERMAQVEAQIDGLLQGITTFREMLQRAQGLLEARHRLAVGGARLRLGAGLPGVA